VDERLQVQELEPGDHLVSEHQRGFKRELALLQSK
jgi:hypothetical protein